MSNHQEGDNSFKITVESLFSLAYKAYDIFESSKIEQKRQLMVFVFSNLTLRGAKLEYSLRNPFQLLVKKRSHQSLAGGLGFEPRLTESESVVLPLDDPPIGRI